MQPKQAISTMSNCQIPDLRRENLDEFVNMLEIERAHGRVQFEKKAVLLAADIARRLDYYRTNVCVHDQFINILHKAFEYKTKEEKIHRRELEKRQYILRRALVEYNQIVKENAATGATLSEFSYDGMESHVEDELREAFVKLVEFMSKTMYVKHDDFITGVHEAARVEDYSLILDQLDAKIHYKFKQNQVLGCHEIAKIACDLTGIPASWFIIEDRNMRYVKLEKRLLKRVFGAAGAIGSIVEVLYNQTDSDRRAETPLGLFLFKGSNWVSKADLARAIAAELYDNEDRLVRIDMAKYAELDSASSLVETIIRTTTTRPCSVLVFDKIEMAHSYVLDTLCSFLKGPGNGFQDTVVIITSELDHVYAAEYMIKFTTLVDQVMTMCWPSDLKDCCRLLLREWAFERTNIEGNRPVIICPSKSALIEMETDAGAGATEEGLQRWMDEKVFSVLSKMVSEYDGAAENIIIYVDKQEETGELTFNFR